MSQGRQDLSAVVRAEVDETQAGTLSAIARTESEIKAAIVVAKQFPRNEAAAHIRIMKSCDRAGFADEAMYSYTRGKGDREVTIEGPSVCLARELARCWGNVQVGLRIVSTANDEVHIVGYAYDAETNTRFEAEDKFSKLVQRSNGWVVPDERTLRELVNRRGAICVRNAILQMIPRDIVEDAVARCKSTLVKVAAGATPEDRKKRNQQLAWAFDVFGVTVAMLERLIGHAYDQLSPEEYTKLRGIWQSMKDGNTKREDHFEVVPTTPPPPTSGTVDLNQVVKPSTTPVAPRASTADSLKPTNGARLVEKRIKVVETGTKAADGLSSKRYVITAEWDGGKGVLTSSKPEHAKLSQEAADTGMLLDAIWEDNAGVLALAKLARTDEPKDESFKSAAPQTATGQIDLG